MRNCPLTTIHTLLCVVAVETISLVTVVSGMLLLLPYKAIMHPSDHEVDYLLSMLSSHVTINRSRKWYRL